LGRNPQIVIGFYPDFPRGSPRTRPGPVATWVILKAAATNEGNQMYPSSLRL
jgi:hypothetical protein